MRQAVTLPIDVVPKTTPALFKWRFVANGRSTECQGYMPASAENAVRNLIEYAKQLVKENKELWDKVEAMKKQPAPTAKAK